MVRIVDLKQSLREDKALVIKVRKEIQDAIRTVENENYISILEMRYLQYMNWNT